MKGFICEELELHAVLDRNIEDLSGGELQRCVRRGSSLF